MANAGACTLLCCAMPRQHHRLPATEPALSPTPSTTRPRSTTPPAMTTPELSHMATAGYGTPSPDEPPIVRARGENPWVSDNFGQRALLPTLGQLGPSRAAMRMAASREDSLAWPVPAMSKAVPWSTDVRNQGSPTVTLTPRSRWTALNGICP